METIQTLAHRDGPRGEVVLRRRVRNGSQVDELIINGAFAMDSSETGTERLLAELALPSGRGHRVLVGGLGLGFTVAALSALEVDAIDVVEIEQCLIDWTYQGIAPSLAAAASDPRVHLHAGDIRLVLEGVIWLLGFPFLAGLAIWQAPFLEAVRLILIAVWAVAYTYMFVPRVPKR